jgi:hypothetical protein
MTATLTPPATPVPELWNSMPGWGIVTNLLPPEILAARRVKVLRKFVIMALAGVLVLGAVGFGYGYWQKGKASSALGAEQARTTELMSEQAKYGEVVKIQGDVAEVQGQLGTLLADDVDFTKLMTAVERAQPRGGSITQLTVTLTVGTATAAAPGADILDSSGRTHIGSIALTGDAPTMTAAAGYVTALSKIPGIVSVYPTSQQSNGKVVQYTIDVSLTDQLLSHRFDGATTTTTTGGK